MRHSLCVAATLVLSLNSADAQSPVRVYPGKQWQTSDNATAWRGPTLDSAKAFLATLPPANVFVVERGRVVFEMGDAQRRIKLSSIRKSFLSALVGIHERAGHLDLDRTLRDVEIDDEPALTPNERQATLRMLIESRSGIYHAYVGGTPDDRARMPVRESHAPGTFWYYNNWDFNALGTAFEKLTHRKIGKEFLEKIARRTQMQDFRLEDMYYFGGTSASRVVEQSTHPAYHFRVSARDLARFGYLFLRRGKWKDGQLIPADWVGESTKAYSKTDNNGGYGYLWWIDGFPGVTEHSYSARGALAKYLVVFPERDLVVVYLNHTEFPDDAAAYPASDIAKLPTISLTKMGQLLSLVLKAQPAANSR